MLKYYIGDGIGWFRVFGAGIHWKDTSKHLLRFSERNGYVKALTFLGWRVSILKPL